MASARVPYSLHSHADRSMSMLKAMQITGDPIFCGIWVPDSTCKVYESKHALNTAVHYSDQCLKVQEVGSLGHFFARGKREWLRFEGKAEDNHRRADWHRSCRPEVSRLMTWSPLTSEFLLHLLGEAWGSLQWIHYYLYFWIVFGYFLTWRLNRHSVPPATNLKTSCIWFPFIYDGYEYSYEFYVASCLQLLVRKSQLHVWLTLLRLRNQSC